MMMMMMIEPMSFGYGRLPIFGLSKC